MNITAQDVYGPHVGHPILRKLRNRSKWWVVIGRYPKDPKDEIWTWSRNCIRDFGRVLTPDGKWWDSYRDSRRLVVEKPFVTRRVAEGLLIEHILNDREQSINATMIDAVGTGLMAERVFELLVADGVLRHPSKRRLGSARWPCPVMSNAQPLRAPLELQTTDVYEINEEKRDEWVATRLLLLQANIAASTNEF